MQGDLDGTQLEVYSEIKWITQLKMRLRPGMTKIWSSENKYNTMSSELIGRKFSPIKSACPQNLVKKFGVIPKHRRV